jgi:hypothetical protein
VRRCRFDYRFGSERWLRWLRHPAPAVAVLVANVRSRDHRDAAQAYAAKLAGAQARNHSHTLTWCGDGAAIAFAARVTAPAIPTAAAMRSRYGDLNRIPTCWEIPCRSK